MELIVEQAFFLGLVGAAWKGSVNSPGLHGWDTQLKHLNDNLLVGNISPHLQDPMLTLENRQLIYIGLLVIGLSMLFIKLSILFQYLALFVPAKRSGGTYWTAQALIGVNGVFYVVYLFAIAFGCSPIQRFWNIAMVEGHCIDFLVINLTACCVNVFSDFAILALHQFSVWRLRLAMRQKAKVSLFFCLGLL